MLKRGFMLLFATSVSEDFLVEAFCTQGLIYCVTLSCLKRKHFGRYVIPSSHQKYTIPSCPMEISDVIVTQALICLNKTLCTFLKPQVLCKHCRGGCGLQETRRSSNRVRVKQNLLTLVSCIFLSELNTAVLCLPSDCS